jgi:hypothetical protein
LDASDFPADCAFVAAVPVGAQVALVLEPPAGPHVVPFAVPFVGFTPVVPGPFWLALPPPDALVVADDFFT